jgi:transcriptional regulator with XRE-family HTH domain
MDMQALSGHLSANLRFLRQRRGLTQAQLAKLCGVPRSTVGQLESGSGNPTLSVLARLAAALQLSIEEILSAPHARCAVFPKGTLPTQSRGKSGSVTVHKLLPDAIPGMEIDRIELSAGGRMTGIPHRPGTREYLCCEKGRITLWTEGEKHVLGAGDVAAFQGDQPHSYQNDGEVTAIGFSVVALAPFASGTFAVAAANG